MSPEQALGAMQNLDERSDVYSLGAMLYAILLLRRPVEGKTVAEVLQKSSNVGTVKMALQMQPREMWETFTAAGFGQKPQITFPGAVSGRLRPFKTWRPVEQATMSYGYGLSASLFQMARSYTVFAHDGQIIPATLLKTDTPAVGVPVFSAKTAAEIRTMLQMAAGAVGVCCAKLGEAEEMAAGGIQGVLITSPVVSPQAIARLIKLNEYKRRQAPIGIRVTHRSFGKDWRYPITSKFRQ